MRGISAILLILLLIALTPLLAFILLGMAPYAGGEPGAVTVTAGPVKQCKMCRAGPITVEVNRVGPDLTVKLQPPNPCYKVVVTTAAAKVGPDGRALVAVEARLDEPSPGTVCPQVLPQPVMVHLDVDSAKTIEASVTLHGSSGNTYSCTATLPYVNVTYTTTTLPAGGRG